MPPTGVPKCDFVSSLGMFRVRKAVGKSFTSGGYGMTLTNNREASIDNGADSERILESEPSIGKGEVSTSQPESAQHLFIEEALVLFERGVLDVFDASRTKLNAHQLYDMLGPLNVPLPIYLTYAHLRSQGYRVLRHVPPSLHYSSIIPASSSAAVERDDSKDTMNNETEQVRQEQDEQQQKSNARASRHFRRTTKLLTLDNDPTAVVFDVYLPNTYFRKTNPGQPQFVVSVASYNVPSPTFVEIQQLQESCRGVPVRIATVSDGGTVIMFGVTDVGAPDISARVDENGDCHLNGDE